MHIGTIQFLQSNYYCIIILSLTGNFTIIYLFIDILFRYEYLARGLIWITKLLTKKLIKEVAEKQMPVEHRMRARAVQKN